ncbi:replication restart helicase PriA [Thermaerobacter subterraneus]|uniref:Replication restart protein PriA n=1 Tax=Thermaerobacter subterraneus DSM 13965 TaxID=867903 RepID=K6NXZ4_9FIRM|nr:primosomal protein N' [Thermaerobacter subterraneus]EKP93740.1 replication restart DNA helicase PriA [Thermaerobacter subterraneus DSM 13965]
MTRKRPAGPGGGEAPGTAVDGPEAGGAPVRDGGEAAAPAQPPCRDPVAEVVVDIAAQDVDRVFHFLVPPELAGRLQVGHRVTVPFGPRRVEGTVVGFAPVPEVPPERLRPILALRDPIPVLTPALIDLARWMEERYLCLFVQALRAMLPPGARGDRVSPAPRRWVRLAVDPAEARARARELAGRAPRQAAVLERLARSGAAGGLPQAFLLQQAAAGPEVVKALERKGWVVVEERLPVLDEPAAAAEPAGPPPPLTPEQAAVWRKLEPALRAAGSGDDPGAGGTAPGRPQEGDQGSPASTRAGEPAGAPPPRCGAGVPAPAGGGAAPQAFLVHGVTGSGKTEIYLRAIAAVLARGQGAICLVPEIALTPQTVARFRARFGNRVAVLHSAMTPAQRLATWRAIRTGTKPVVVGARSAIFAPVPRLGLIVVDEEHETSYKQEETPRYHAREVALARARLEGAVVILGSATPSVETYHRALAGELGLLELSRRVGERPLPAVELVDMREEFEAGHRSIFSRRLLELMRQRLEAGQQVLLFLNRRGYHTVLLCRECGFVLRCPHCDVSLTFHQLASGRLVCRCHYCEHRQVPPATCPRCGGVALHPFGLGTQKVEEAARQLFPGARIQRMDADVTARRGAHEAIYRQFAAGRIDILIGTQMIAKGWDVPGVTLVGVVSADTALHMPDFRRQERTFQLLEQVAGRAGRGSDPGQVVIQTYSPDHPCLQAVADHDYRALFDLESAARRELGFPPFGHLIRAVVAGAERPPVERAAARLAAAWRAALAEAGVEGGSVTPAAPAPIERLRGRWRWHVLARAADGPALREATRAALASLRPHWPRDVLVQVDVDPYSML